MRTRSDARRMLAQSRPIPPLAYARDGLGESGEARYLRLRDASSDSAAPMQALPERARTAVYVAAERRRLERDLHDGVQNELVALIVELGLVQEDLRTPPALADVLGGLEARAQASLDSTRAIVRGIYPPLLTAFGLTEALRAQAARSAIDVSIVGTASRSSEAAEGAVYFCCSEAIHNAAKHAGRTAKVKLWVHDDGGALAVRIADDGRGFDPAYTRSGAGLQNIRERIEDLGGSFKVVSKLGRGTVLTVSVPWPARAHHRQ